MSPFCSIAHNNGTALLVIFVDSKFHDCFFAGDVQLFVDFVLDGQPMRVPAEAPLHMITLHRPIPGNDVFDGRCQEMSIMRESSSKGWSIIEGVTRPSVGKLDLPMSC